MSLDSLCIELPAIVKARDVGGRRVVEVEASNEAVDSEGDKILQSALLGSAADFVKSGHLDLDHLSEIGDRLGLADPGEFIVGRPVEVKDLGAGRTGVIGELHKGNKHADSLWDSLTAEPPVLWRASIYGFPLPSQVIDCRVSKAEDAGGATRFLVKGLQWKSLAFTRHPINDAITGNARVITGKSFIELAKARIHSAHLSSIKATDYILSPGTPEELVGHYYYHIKAGKCPHVLYKGKGFQDHFQYCCGDTLGEATLKSLALTELLNNVEQSDRVRQVMDKKTTFIESITSMFQKALGEKLEGIKEVEDLWQPEPNEHENPSKREVLTGPAERSSGGNAQPMVSRNSDFAPQAGLVRQYEALDGLMADMAKAFRAEFSVHKKAIETLAGAIAAMQKADVAKMDETTFIGKAQSKLAKARVAVRKADLADEEDKEEREERKAHLSAAQDLLKAAKRLLSKASEDSKAEEEDEIEKAIEAVKALSVKVHKAQAAIIKAEEDEKEEEKEEAKKAECATCPTCSPTKKAEAEDEKEEEKEKEEAAKAATVKAEDTEDEEKKDDTAKAAHIEKTLAGFEVQLASLNDMFKAVMGQSRHSAVATPPNFMKAAPAADISVRLDEAIDSGGLEAAQGMYAQTLYQRLKAADSGKIKREDVMQQIAAAPEAIRNIFQAAA